MAPAIKKFPIGNSRFRNAVLEGFVRLDAGGLETVDASARHICFLERIDGGRRSCQWGRLRFKAELEEGAIPVVRAFATDDERLIVHGKVMTYDAMLLNPRESALEKQRLFELAGASKFVGKSDVLLYEQEGRYLWLCVEALGQGKAVLRDFEVFSPRDNFFGSFPEIYRVNGEFFHRYLAVFSSLYYDLQETIDSLDGLVDADTAPRDALPILAEWLGLDPDDGSLDESQFRRLLKAAFGTIRAKGTRKAAEDVLRVFLDEPFYIVCARTVREIAAPEDRAVLERLYGNNPFDFTVLIRRAPDERLHARLKYLIRQFAPLRARAEIVFLGNTNRLDGHAYCDVNARVAGFGAGSLDGSAVLDGAHYISAEGAAVSDL
jgi:phage tail-like protein